MRVIPISDGLRIELYSSDEREAMPVIGIASSEGGVVLVKLSEVNRLVAALAAGGAELATEAARTLEAGPTWAGKWAKD